MTLSGQAPRTITRVLYLHPDYGQVPEAAWTLVTRNSCAVDALPDVPLLVVVPDVPVAVVGTIVPIT